MKPQRKKTYEPGDEENEAHDQDRGYLAELRREERKAFKKARKEREQRRADREAGR